MDPIQEPTPEPLEEIVVAQVQALGRGADVRHPLDDSPNPLLRALPHYERQFKLHFQQGQAVFGASQQRFRVCQALAQQQQVQALALQTARGNMGLYYSHICAQQAAFMRTFEAQHARHTGLLACFERDMDRLRGCQLHPALRSLSPLRRTLLDCVKEPELRKWAQDCTISHALYASKVGELQALFNELHESVEALLQAGPTADGTGLDAILEHGRKCVEEQDTILQSLSKDLGTVKKLVEDAVGSRLSSSLRPLDACAALDPMSEVHQQRLLPRIEACDAKLAGFLQEIHASKNAMSISVHRLLQSVASLQSRIRDLRNQLAAYKEAGARQDEIFSELALVRRVAISYRACLAEVVRRKAFATLYTGQASQYAESMAKAREEEVAKREAFMRYHSPRYLPRDILERMGLLLVPPVCQVSVPPFDTSLLDITLEDIRRMQLRGGVRGSSGMHDEAGTGGGDDDGTQQEGDVHGEDTHSQGEAGREGNDKEETDTGGEVLGAGRLEMENAYLKAELASAIASMSSMEPVSGRAEGSRLLLGRGGEDLQEETESKYAEALRLREAYSLELKRALKAERAQRLEYEQRILSANNTAPAAEHEQQKQRQAEGGSVHDLVSNMRGKVEDLQLSPPAAVGEGLGNEALVPEDQEIADARVKPGIEAEETLVDPVPRALQVATDGNETQQEEAEEIPIAVVDITDSSAEPHGSIGPATEAAPVVHIDMPEAEDAEGKEATSIPGVSAANEQEKGVGKHIPSNADGMSGVVEKSESLSRLQQALDEEKAEVVALHAALKEKSLECMQVQEELGQLRVALEKKEDVLIECQVNCAHQENELQDARRLQASTQATANRRQAEYEKLRTDSVQLRGLLERLNKCLMMPAGGGGGAGRNTAVEGLRGLAATLCTSSDEEGSRQGSEWVLTAVRILAERAAQLAAERAALADRSAAADLKIEVMSTQLTKGASQLNNLLKEHAKAGQAAQAGKEKLCFTRFQVHELAAFALNAHGNYEAINLGCPNFFLSEQSISLFNTDDGAQQQRQPLIIVGQIVHIEYSAAREEAPSNLASTSRPAGNPFGLPAGTPFAVVTVTMLPEVVEPLNTTQNAGK